MNVMVVDDEPDVELLFRQKFRREVRSGSLHLHFARSGEEALAQLAEPGKCCSWIRAVGNECDEDPGGRRRA